MHENSSCSRSLSELHIVIFFIFLLGIYWYPIVILFWIFLMTNQIQHIFMHLFVTHIYFIMKCLMQYFYILIEFSLIVEFWVLYLFWIFIPFLGMQFENIFPKFVACFNHLNNDICRSEVSESNKIKFIICLKWVMLLLLDQRIFL